MAHQKKKINKNIIWTFISVMLAVLTVRIVLKQNSEMSFSELMDLIGSSNKGFMLAAVAFSAMYVVFEAFAISCIIKRSGYGKVPFNGLIYSTSDVYFSAITPSSTGGQPASIFFMMRDGIPGGIATAALILNLFMYTLSIITLGFVSIVIEPDAFQAFSTFSKVLIIVGFSALSLLSVLISVVLRNDRLIFEPLTALIDKLHKINIIRNKDGRIARLEKMRSDYRRCSGIISNSRRILLYSFLLNLIQRASQIVVPVLVYRSLGGKSAHMLSVFAKQCLITIGYNYVPVPGGMGISDYLMIDGFTDVMGESMAFNVELISRGITFYICVAISGLITLAWHLWKRRVSGDTQKEEAI
ncbi:MAG: flippase-like domain-containing protein [Lachnospiraceae bacterium]|nr:flippase-like domain-containing protein [Lachnospiraceae bacterium]